MNQFNAPAYDLQRFTGRCAFSDAPLNPGDTYIAALVEEGELLRRLDICVAVWDEGKRPANLFSFWKTVVPDSNAKKKMFVDNEVLMNLLQRLADATQPQRLAFRFVLALILMRKKLLRYDKTEHRPAAPAPDAAPDAPPTGEQEFWVMTPKLDLSKGIFGKWNEEEKLTVLDPHLDEEGIRQVTDQLSEILQAEL